MENHLVVTSVITRVLIKFQLIVASDKKRHINKCTLLSPVLFPAAVFVNDWRHSHGRVYRAINLINVSDKINGFIVKHVLVNYIFAFISSVISVLYFCILSCHFLLNLLLLLYMHRFFCQTNYKEKKPQQFFGIRYANTSQHATRQGPPL
jgi:hypothetical protein